jgi:hypothetical protein
MKLFPVHFWDELNSQSPKFRRKFSQYKQFAKTSMDDLLTEEEKKDMLILETKYTASSYIENLGQGKFRVKPLPTEAQTAPVNGLLAGDFNNDGKSDVMMVGNDYGNEVFAGRYDAFSGLILTGDGHGNFTALSVAQSGFFVDGDGKALAKVACGEEEIFIATQNRDSLMVFSGTTKTSDITFLPAPLDAWVEIQLASGKMQKIEMYYGSGYLSQSTRRIRIPKDATMLVVFDFQGKRREVALTSL